MTSSAVPTDIRRDLVAALPRLRRFAIVLTGSAFAADTLVEKTCASAVLNSHLWTGDSRLEGWVFGLMRSNWADDAKNRDAVGYSEHGQPRSNDAAGRLFQCLPCSLAAPLLLVDTERFSYAEAASILGMSTEDLSARLCHARLHLSVPQPHLTERRA